MENWHKRLVEIREKHLLKQKDIADAIGKDITRVSRYERGKGSKAMPAFMKQKLKAVFTPEEIAYIESGELPKTDKVNDSGVIYGKDERVTLPYYPDIYASAGGGAYPYLQKSNPMSFSKTFLEMHLGLQNYKNLFILNTTGESMEPTLKDGSLIFVNPMENEENIRDGGIYVLLCDNVILVKRVFVDPVNKVFKLISDHPSYEDINLDAISVDVEHGCRFMGRVVGSFDRV